MEVNINIDADTARQAIVRFLRDTTTLLNGIPASDVRFELFQNATDRMAGIVTFTQKPDYTE